MLSIVLLYLFLCHYSSTVCVDTVLSTVSLNIGRMDDDISRKFWVFVKCWVDGVHIIYHTFIYLYIYFEICYVNSLVTNPFPIFFWYYFVSISQIDNDVDWMRYSTPGWWRSFHGMMDWIMTSMSFGKMGQNNREYTAEIMFETFGVPGLYIAVQAVLALAASWSAKAVSLFFTARIGIEAPCCSWILQNVPPLFFSAL